MINRMNKDIIIVMANKLLFSFTNIDINKTGSILGQAEIFMLFFVFFKDAFMSWNFYLFF